MVRTVPPNGGGRRYPLSFRTVVGTAIVAHRAFLSPTFSWGECHGAQCCALSPNDGNSAVAAYWAVFLSHRTPAGTVVAAHTVMISCQAAAVAAVDVVKIFVI